MNGQVIFYPNVTVETFDSDGVQVTREQSRNLVTTSGLNVVRELLLRGVTGTSVGYAPRYIALGSSSTVVSAADVALGAEVYRDDITVRASSSKVATFQLFLDTGDGNGLTFREAGLFDSPDNGEMLSRVVFTSIDKTSSLQVAITWDINLAGS